ncbi:sulfotransferase 1B1-like [Ptychodera flava]|uniref:sulfotransferase 1B1-like n=1 Tax=Ptychodera flava TaxID=63121 RepID=UPI00396A779E
MVDAETVANAGRKLNVERVKNFKVREDDVFLVTFPKSGFSWMKEILPLVMNGGNIDKIKDIPPDVRVPYLEFALSVDTDEASKKTQELLGVPEGFDVDAMKSPRTIGSHLRDDLLPKEIDEKKAKVIYVARNPKDVSVSIFHFCQLLLKGLSATNPELSPYEDFNEFFPDVVEIKRRAQAVVYDGSKWHEHVLPWWKRRHEKNVLFLKYEDMIKDLKAAVRQIAQFLEIELTDEVVKTISDYCSFDSMKKRQLSLKADFTQKFMKAKPNESPFVRKGKVGGWKNYFTVAQNESYDNAYREWMKGSDLEMTFEG